MQLLENLTSDPLAVIGLICALMFFWWLYRVNNSDNNTYRLSDLVTTKGRFDLSKVGQLLCLLTTTWIVIHMELKTSIPEWALGLYMLAWVGAGFGSLYARIKGGPIQSSSSVETTTVAKSTEVIQPSPAAAPMPGAAGPLPRPPIT